VCPQHNCRYNCQNSLIWKKISKQHCDIPTITGISHYKQITNNLNRNKWYPRSGYGYFRSDNITAGMKQRNPDSIRQQKTIPQNKVSGAVWTLTEMRVLYIFRDFQRQHLQYWPPNLIMSADITLWQSFTLNNLEINVEHCQTLPSKREWRTKKAISQLDSAVLCPVTAAMSPVSAAVAIIFHNYFGGRT